MEKTVSFQSAEADVDMAHDLYNQIKEKRTLIVQHYKAYMKQPFVVTCGQPTPATQQKTAALKRIKKQLNGIHTRISTQCTENDWAPGREELKLSVMFKFQ